LASLKAVVLETPELADQPRVGYLAEEWRRQEDLGGTAGLPRAFASFLGVEAFATVFNLTWLTVA